LKSMLLYERHAFIDIKPFFFIENMFYHKLIDLKQ
jgi:hypothetical protein